MYDSDLTDCEWDKIKHFFKRPDPRGAKSVHSKRTIVNAILYLVKTGCQWRLLPNDFPPWSTVYDHYRKWDLNSVWDKVLKYLNKETRKKQRRNPDPTYAAVDSQSVKTQYDSEERGFDGGKKS